MKASDYIRAYNMKKEYENEEFYYKRQIDKVDKIIMLKLKKIEETNECYLEKQVFFKDKQNKNGTFGLWGEKEFVFGIKNDLFRRAKYNELEAIYG